METGKIKVTIEQCLNANTLYQVKLNIDSSTPSLYSNPSSFSHIHIMANKYRRDLGLLENYAIEITYQDGSFDNQQLSFESFNEALKYAATCIKSRSVISVNVKK